MPGAGFLPKIMAVLIMFGLALVMRAQEPALCRISWSDGKHAADGDGDHRASAALYTSSASSSPMADDAGAAHGDRAEAALRPAYSVGLCCFAYVLFGITLKSPLERGTPF